MYKRIDKVNLMSFNYNYSIFIAELSSGCRISFLKEANKSPKDSTKCKYNYYWNVIQYITNNITSFLYDIYFWTKLI